MRLPVLGLAFFLVLLPPLFAQQPQQAIEDSRRGFDKQYKRMFIAFRKTREPELRQRFEDFAIPSHWFTDAFGSGTGATLANRYSEEFEKFKYSTVNLFATGGAQLVTHVWKRDQESKLVTTPTPPSLLPVPPVEYFKIEYGTAGHTGESVFGGGDVVLDWGSNAIWRGSFIYVDGAFRFFGLEGYPFWDLKDDEPGGFCADTRVQGGQIVNKVRPAYPADAKQSHIRGVVKLNVTVAEDGSVKHVEIVSGNPILRGAAQQVVLQWHYFPPFRQCSQPVERILAESVKFPPR
jgi:TonB family protein